MSPPLNRLAMPSSSTSTCARLALLGWAIAGLTFAVASALTWAGTILGFLVWTVVALPLLGISAVWLHQIGRRLPAGWLVLALVPWGGTLAVILGGLDSMPLFLAAPAAELSFFLPPVVCLGMGTHIRPLLSSRFEA